jgi:hypothetical protein
MSDLDTKAADQFQPVHRSGHGAITFEGREWTRLEWIERTARNGGTLAAGEGAVLCGELDRLRRFEAWFARFAADRDKDYYVQAMIEYYGDPRAPLPGVPR